MSKVKKCIFLLLLAVVTVCMLTACNRKKPEEDGMKIIFSEKILGIAEITPEEWVEDLLLSVMRTMWMCMSMTMGQA